MRRSRSRSRRSVFYLTLRSLMSHLHIPLRTLIVDLLHHTGGCPVLMAYLIACSDEHATQPVCHSHLLQILSDSIAFMCST